MMMVRVRCERLQGGGYEIVDRSLVVSLLRGDATGLKLFRFVTILFISVARGVTSFTAF